MNGRKEGRLVFEKANDTTKQPGDLTQIKERTCEVNETKAFLTFGVSLEVYASILPILPILKATYAHVASTIRAWFFAVVFTELVRDGKIIGEEARSTKLVQYWLHDVDGSFIWRPVDW